MMRQIKPLSVSEEMLGAYLEGNLSLEESRYVEDLIGKDEDLQAFVGDVTTLDVDNGVSIYDECPDFNAAFELPQVATDYSDGSADFLMKENLSVESNIYNDFLAETYNLFEENMDTDTLLDNFSVLEGYDNNGNNLEMEDFSEDNGGWNEEDMNNNIFNDLNYD